MVKSVSYWINNEKKNIKTGKLWTQKPAKYINSVKNIYMGSILLLIYILDKFPHTLRIVLTSAFESLNIHSYI